MASAKFGLSGASKDTDRCLRLGQDLTQISCGFAWARFLLDSVRRKTVRDVWTYDVAGGLSTAATGLRKFSPRLQPKSAAEALKLANKIEKTWKRMKERGKKATGKEIEKIKKDIDKLESQFKTISDRAERGCKLKTSRWERDLKKLEKGWKKGRKRGR